MSFYSIFSLIWDDQSACDFSDCLIRKSHSFNDTATAVDPAASICQAAAGGGFGGESKVLKEISAEDKRTNFRLVSHTNG